MRPPQLSASRQRPACPPDWCSLRYFPLAEALLRRGGGALVPETERQPVHHVRLQHAHSSPDGRLKQERAPGILADRAENEATEDERGCAKLDPDKHPLRLLERHDRIL